MRGKNQSKEFSVSGKGVFVGIGVHKESWQFTVRTERKKFFMDALPVTTVSFGGFRIVLPGVR